MTDYLIIVWLVVLTVGLGLTIYTLDKIADVLKTILKIMEEK